MNPHPFVLLSTPVKERDLTEIAELLETDPRRDRHRLPADVAEHVGSAARVVRAVDPDDGRLLGVGWVISDGLGEGYHADVFVAEDRRREGIGSVIVRQLGTASRIARPTWLVGHPSGTSYPRLVRAEVEPAG